MYTEKTVLLGQENVWLLSKKKFFLSQPKLVDSIKKRLVGTITNFCWPSSHIIKRIL